MVVDVDVIAPVIVDVHLNGTGPVVAIVIGSDRPNLLPIFPVQNVSDVSDCTHRSSRSRARARARAR
jgi:hypothetical protein